MIYIKCENYYHLAPIHSRHGYARLDPISGWQVVDCQQFALVFESRIDADRILPFIAAIFSYQHYSVFRVVEEEIKSDKKYEYAVRFGDTYLQDDNHKFGMTEKSKRTLFDDKNYAQKRCELLIQEYGYNRKGLKIVKVPVKE